MRSFHVGDSTSVSSMRHHKLLYRLVLDHCALQTNLYSWETTFNFLLWWVQVPSAKHSGKTECPRQVRSHAARRQGLDVSLFRRLSDAHPDAVAELAYQYRMNEDIMSLSNKLIYSDRLRCGSHEVAKRRLRLPNAASLSNLHTQPCHSSGCWLKELMQERCVHVFRIMLLLLSRAKLSCSVVFVNTDAVPAIESFHGNLPQNEVEASLVCQVSVETLIKFLE